MKYITRQEFEQICRTNIRYHRVEGKKYTRCHDSFWLLMYPGDRAISDNISAFGYWEPWDAMAMSNLLYQRPHYTFIDVGANIGYYSIMAADLGNKVHAFECNPDMIPYIEDSARINNFKIDIHPVALGDSEGTAQLSVNKEHLGGASLIEQPVEDYTITVPITTLDASMHDLDANFIIKVDVEGFERHVWWGAKELREKLDNIWFVEWFNNRWTESDQRAFLEEVSETHKLGVTTHSGHIESRTIDQIVETYFATLVFTKKS